MGMATFTESQMVSILKPADAGMAGNDIYRQAGSALPRFYPWKSRSGAMEASELKPAKEL